MSVYAMKAVQKAVFEVLNGDATLMGMVNGIYDAVPENSAFPYILFQSVRIEHVRFSDGAKRSEVRLVMRIFNTHGPRDSLYTVIERLVALLDDQPLTLDVPTILIRGWVQRSECRLVTGNRVIEAETEFRAIVEVEEG